MTDEQIKELTDILTVHARKYPLMLPTDAVKLIYQNEFGGGHLISNRERALAYLIREYEGLSQTDSPLTESIGNGIVRVSLCALDRHGIAPEELFDAFVSSAELIRGDIEGFKEKLGLLSTLTADGFLPFSSDELSEYLDEYAAAGYPAVSHSDPYRNTYRPAYRIVLERLLPSIQKG